ncbi:MAG: acetate--CoA ligase family protein [Granulosicoccus sp.]
MKNRFERLLSPQSIAVFGGQWAASVASQCRKLGYKGEIWPVHPSHTSLEGFDCFASVDELPAAPDACFLGVNNESTIDIVGQLSLKGAGGAVCFAAGFSETASRDTQAESRQARLIEAAGAMPLLGPNCYGLINYVDRVALWPDQHGGRPADSGVAIITQSSNIAINLTMQQRGLPVSYVVTVGNQAQTTHAELAASIIEDERVTALGLHIEGFSDIRAFEALASRAREIGKHIVVLKTGVTQLSRAALLSHTRSLSGDDAAAGAFLERLNMIRVHGLGEFVETLKVLNSQRPVGGYRLLSMSCSGGEAAMMGDVAQSVGLTFPVLSTAQKTDLDAVLGKQLRLSNPLDYHTAIWDDSDAMEGMVRAMLQARPVPGSDTVSANDQFESIADIALLVLDFPRQDRCNSVQWKAAADAYIEATRDWQGFSAVLATMPENMPESMADYLIAAGVVPLAGMRDGLLALRNAAWLNIAAQTDESPPVWLADQQTVTARAAVLSLLGGQGSSSQAVDKPSARRASQQAWGLVKAARSDPQAPRMLDESIAKRWLNRFGVRVPVSVRLSFADVRSSLMLSKALDKASPTFSYPVVAKGLGLVHKSEANAIELHIENRRELERAIQRIDCEGGCLIEEYVGGGVAELLVSVVYDPVHGLLMTLSAGGIFTEMLRDSEFCLLPASRKELDRRLQRLRCAPLLNGFRGRAVIDRECLLDALEAVQQAALQLGERLVELEVNPLICTSDSCIAVDALLAVRDA